MKRDHQKEVIRQLLLILGEHGHPGLVVRYCPDERNRETEDIDAIAGSFAIEHTSIDGMPQQRGHDDRFLKLVRGLREELRPGLTFQANVTISYDDLLELTSQSVRLLRAALLTWLRDRLPVLTDGVHRFPRSSDLPFAVSIRKWSNRRPGVYFMRDFPGDSTRGEQLRKQFAEKAAKLKIYKDQPEGYTTLLLIELHSSALMGIYAFIDWFYSNYENSYIDGVDEIWCAIELDTSCTEFWKLGEVARGPLFLELETDEACNTAAPADQKASLPGR